MVNLGWQGDKSNAESPDGFDWFWQKDSNR